MCLKCERMCSCYPSEQIGYLNTHSTVLVHSQSENFFGSKVYPCVIVLGKFQYIDYTREILGTGGCIYTE